MTSEATPDQVDGIIAAWRAERPDIDVSSVGVVSRIFRLGRHLQRVRRRRLEELGTDPVTVDVLATLRRSGPPYRRSAGELSQSSLITSGGVSQRLRKLEASGLVVRYPDVADRRRVEVELTPTGAELIDSIAASVLDHEAQLLGCLTSAEQETLQELLRKLLNHFE